MEKKRSLFLRPDITPVSKAIYGVIAACAEEGTKASKSVIMESLNICEESYLTHIKPLLENGYIEREVKPFKGTEYKLITAPGISVYGKTVSQGKTVCGESSEKEKRSKKEKDNKSYINSSSSGREAFSEVETEDEEDMAYALIEKSQGEFLAAGIENMQSSFKCCIKQLILEGVSITTSQLNYCIRKWAEVKPKYTVLMPYLKSFIANSILEADLICAEEEAKKAKEKAQREAFLKAKEEEEGKARTEKELIRIASENVDGFNEVREALREKNVQRASLTLHHASEEEKAALAKEIEELNTKYQYLLDKAKDIMDIKDTCTMHTTEPVKETPLKPILQVVVPNNNINYKKDIDTLTDKCIKAL